MAKIIALVVICVTMLGVEAAFSSVVPSDGTLPTGNPPSFFDRRENVVFPVGVSESLTNKEPAVLHTNKFYTNFLLAEAPARAAWTLPYIVTVNTAVPFGLSVSHPKIFDGERADDGRLEWYANTVAKDIILTAKELSLSQEVALTDFDEYGLSATVQFDDGNGGSMTTYLVRGMAYATVLYDGITPVVSSAHAILTVNGVSAAAGPHANSNGRFQIELNDGSTWILYSSKKDIQLSFKPGLPDSPNQLEATKSMSGTLRATLVPYQKGKTGHTTAVTLLDAHSAVFPTSASLKAEWEIVSGTTNARYTIKWKLGGDTSVELLHYALPHQQDRLFSSMKTSVYLRSPTKGNMMLVKRSTWTISEKKLPKLDWVPAESAITDYLEREWVEYYLEKEVAATLDNYAGSSVYFGGKHLMAYAQLCLVADEMGRDDLVEACVDQVESALAVYVAGKNGNPLVYDTTWGGLIGALGLEEGGIGADFYAAHYNDHHFHYSYLVNAAAVLAKLRPAWATGSNKDYVETLIRDVNAPSLTDKYFPMFRSFDWFCGHSWARGILFAYDGKDQESTSEDVNFYYAMTMWAIATGNSKLEGLGRLQTAMVTRSIQRYFLMKDDNDVHPADFVRNKVTGIFFESKVDYTTWFGDNVEYIHGIQNIPVTAVTEKVRDAKFCSEEWTGRLGSVVGGVTGVWKTILYMSYATVQKHVAFKEMLTSGVDDGLSRTWALYWAATRPNCDTYCDHDAVDLDDTPVSKTGGYGGGPADIPGTIEAEEYDFGGQNVAYYDADPGNNGGAFRVDEGVDVKVIATGGYYVGWTSSGEFMRYSVTVATTGTYDFEFIVAAPPLATLGSFRVVAGGSDCKSGADLTGIVQVKSTGGWDVFKTIEVSGVAGLSAGEKFLYFCTETSGYNVDSFTMTTSLGGPFGGEPVDIPGTVQAENFDVGGAGVAYFDTGAGNTGKVFRLDEDVDIQANNGGYHVGWTNPNEYMRYTVDVTEAANSYDFKFLVAVKNASATFRVVAGGSDCTEYDQDLTGLVEVFYTGGWTTFKSITWWGGGGRSLPIGRTVLFFCSVSNGFNIDSFTMSVHS